MLPWVSAALLSPALAFGVLSLVLLATVVLYLIAKEAVAKLGPQRIISGYLAAFAVAAAVAGVASISFSLTLHEFVALLALFTYPASISLAMLTVPVVCIASTRGHGSAPLAIAATTLAGIAVALTAYVLRPQGLEASQEHRLLFVVLWFVPFAAMVGIGFSIGAHLPWSIRMRAG